jgi:hypothetical protein
MFFQIFLLIGITAVINADHHIGLGEDHPHEVHHQGAEANITDHQHGPHHHDLIVADAAHPWIGKWESIEGRQENLDNLVHALGVGAHYEAGEKVYHKLWKDGAHYHHKIAVPSKNYSQHINFKLGEEGLGKFNNSEYKYKYTEEGQDLHAEYKLSVNNIVLHDIYHVANGELEKTYQIGDVIAKRWFKPAVKGPVIQA